MAIKLKRFVDININYNLSTSSNATRDTAVLIVNRLKKDSETGTDVIYSSEIFSSLKDFADKTDEYNRFKEGKELYYYGYCFFNNGGKNINLISVAKEATVTYPKVTDDDRIFTNGDLFIDSAGATSATPQNCNNGSQLYEAVGTAPETYAATEDPQFVQNKTYFMDDQGASVASPKSCELYYENSVLNPLTQKDIETVIDNLSEEMIVITSNAPWNIMKDVCDSLYNEQEGMNIESKLILSCIPNTITTLPEAEHITSNGFVLKYGTPGVQMAIAAYLTQINANRPNSVQDYYFTTETVQYLNGKEKIGYVCEDDSLAETLLALEINFNSTLVNEVRNLGGNTTKGKDLVNEFMLILVHQTLTERLVQLLTQKIKYNQTGLSLVGATIADELQRYVNNGYLTTDKIWTDPDLIQDGITIINKNTPLQNGYKYVILPFSTLSAEDRQNHKLPSIYILIADSYAIRKIEIDGEVF